MCLFPPLFFTCYYFWQGFPPFAGPWWLFKEELSRGWGVLFGQILPLPLMCLNRTAPDWITSIFLKAGTNYFIFFCTWMFSCCSPSNMSYTLKYVYLVVDGINWYHTSPCLFFFHCGIVSMSCASFFSQISALRALYISSFTQYFVSSPVSSCIACFQCSKVPIFSVLSITIYYSAIVCIEGSCAGAVWARLNWVCSLLLTPSVLHELWNTYILQLLHRQNIYY